MAVTKESKIICPKCATEMDQGRLLNNGLVWSGKKFDKVYENVVKGCEALPAYGVLAFRCPKCSYIELYTADDEQA